MVLYVFVIVVLGVAAVKLLGRAVVRVYMVIPPVWHALAVDSHACAC